MYFAVFQSGTHTFSSFVYFPSNIVLFSSTYCFEWDCKLAFSVTILYPILPQKKKNTKKQKQKQNNRKPLNEKIEKIEKQNDVFF